MSSFFAAVEWPFGIAAGTAVGGAVAGGITPGVQSIINEANTAHAVKPPAYAMLAEGVASGHIDPGWAANRAAEQGIGNEAFAHVVDAMRSGPGSALAFELWRRNLIDDAAFGRALKRESLDDEWIGPLRGLKERLLSPEELANARQQEFVDDGRLHSEGALQGVSAERMDLLFKMAGLPPGVMDGLTMLRRGIIDEATYRALVAEGHTKTKYTDDLLGLRNHILSQTDAAGLWLRGWINQAEAERIGALNGYDAQAMLRLYQNRGRPATVHQVHIGYARGGAVQGAADEREAVHQSVVRSDIRPEFEGVLWAGRYTYPSAFVIRALTQDGTFSRDVAHQTLIEMGWKPELATLAADAWSGGGATATAQPWLNRARGRLFTTAHAEYLDGEIPDTAAVAVLERIGASAAEANAVVDLWTEERGIFRKDLTQAQVLKFYKRGDWTRTQAFDWLIQHALSEADANALLDFV